MNDKPSRYEVFSKENRDARLFWNAVFGFLALVFLFLGLLSLRKRTPLPPLEVKAEEEILTMAMNPSMLKDALESKASEWCNVSHPVYGDFVISSLEGSTPTRLYDVMMLTDSMAPNMAKEYPHLFKYIEEDGIKLFIMKATKESVTVPVWLVKQLVEHEVLQLPDVERHRR